MRAILGPVGAVILAGVVCTGCATKRYPIATPLSEPVAQRMSCEDLETEYLETQDLRRQIVETAEFDWRSVAGFLGDYGIGNAMARSEADRALEDRQASIRAAQATNGCL